LKVKKKGKRTIRKKHKKTVLLNSDLDNLYKLSNELSSASSKLRTKSELYSMAAMHQKQMSDLTDIALKRMGDELKVVSSVTTNLKKVTMLLTETFTGNGNTIIDARELQLVNENEKFDNLKGKIT
jgi:hypothetical protein